MERNRRVFSGVETPLEQLKDKWLKTLFFWKEEVFGSSLLDVAVCVGNLFFGNVISLSKDVSSASSLLPLLFLLKYYLFLIRKDYYHVSVAISWGPLAGPLRTVSASSVDGP